MEQKMIVMDRSGRKIKSYFRNGTLYLKEPVSEIFISLEYKGDNMKKKKSNKKVRY